MFGKSSFWGAAGCLALALGGPASASIIFSNGLTGPADTGIDDSTSFEITEDGTTLTLATAAGSMFNITTTGTGIDTDPAGNNGSDQAFNIDAGEDFTLSFDAGGTLDELSVLTLANGGSPGSLTVTFTNVTASTTPVVTVVPISGGANAGVVVDAGDLAFSAGDIINVALSNPSSDNDDFRIETVTATIPEPGSMALAFSGTGLLLLRRRK